MTLRRPMVVAAGGFQQLQTSDQLLVPALAARSTTVTIAAAQTQIVGFTLPTNTLKVGSVIRFHGMGLLSNTTAATSSVFRLAMATASLGTPIVGSFTVALGTTARTNCPFEIVGTITVLSIGASGTAWGMIVINVNSTTPLALPTTQIVAQVTIDTTAALVVELNGVSGGSTTTWVFTAATMQLYQP